MGFLSGGSTISISTWVTVWADSELIRFWVHTALVSCGGVFNTLIGLQASKDLGTKYQHLHEHVIHLQLWRNIWHSYFVSPGLPPWNGIQGCYDRCKWHKSRCARLWRTGYDLKIHCQKIPTKLLTMAVEILPQQLLREIGFGPGPSPPPSCFLSWHGD